MVLDMLEQLIGSSKAIDKAIAGEELTYDDGMELMNYDNLHTLGAVADMTRKRLVGDTVSFVASYYMNYTNLCAASCQMCAFYRKEGADDAYTLTPEQIEKRVGIAKEMGAEIITSACPSCKMVLDDAAKNLKTGARVLDIVELLAQKLPDPDDDD